MMVKVFQSNANGKIEFTRAELEKLLNEVYKKGYNTGVCDTKQNYWTWTSPYISTTNLGTPKVTYTTNTSTPIDNLKCDNASKDNSHTISASSVTPNSITVQLNDVAEIPTNVNLAKSIDDIVNALFNSDPKGVKTSTSKNLAPNGCIEASTPYAKLAKELRGL